MTLLRIKDTAPQITQLASSNCLEPMNHQNSAYKFKSSNGLASGNNHLHGGLTGGGSYRQQRSGLHALQQQPLNLSQVRYVQVNIRCCV